jgi:Zn-dependent peptidase ImmA (M78 family)
MNIPSYQKITDILAKHQKNLPVQVLKIAEALKINIYKGVDWPDDLCGKIVKDTTSSEGSGFSIYFNEKHHLNRQRFTIAHEIAHFILHQDLIGDGITDDALYRSRLSNSQEVMANKLAADILMPWDLINEKIREGLNTVEKLAEVFEVSPTAMSIRLGIPSN